MLVGHRQAWAWQDEWHGLTIEDIRQLEKQAQLELAKRMDSINRPDGLDNPTTSADAIIKNIETERSTPINNDEKVNYNKVQNETASEVSTTANVINYSFKKRESSIVSISNQERLLGIHMKHIEQVESDEETDTDSLYFDALGMWCVFTPTEELVWRIVFGSCPYELLTRFLQNSLMCCFFHIKRWFWRITRRRRRSKSR